MTSGFVSNWKYWFRHFNAPMKISFQVSTYFLSIKSFTISVSTEEGKAGPETAVNSFNCVRYL